MELYKEIIIFIDLPLEKQLLNVLTDYRKQKLAENKEKFQKFIKSLKNLILEPSICDKILCEKLFTKNNVCKNYIFDKNLTIKLKQSLAISWNNIKKLNYFSNKITNVRIFEVNWKKIKEITNKFDDISGKFFDLRLPSKNHKLLVNDQNGSKIVKIFCINIFETYTMLIDGYINNNLFLNQFSNDTIYMQFGADGCDVRGTKAYLESVGALCGEQSSSTNHRITIVFVVGNTFKENTPNLQKLYQKTNQGNLLSKIKKIPSMIHLVKINSNNNCYNNSNNNSNNNNNNTNNNSNNNNNNNSNNNNTNNNNNNDNKNIINSRFVTSTILSFDKNYHNTLNTKKEKQYLNMNDDEKDIVHKEWKHNNNKRSFKSKYEKRDINHNLEEKKEEETWEKEYNILTKYLKTKTIDSNLLVIQDLEKESPPFDANELNTIVRNFCRNASIKDDAANDAFKELPYFADIEEKLCMYIFIFV